MRTCINLLLILNCSFSLNQFAAAGDTLKVSASFWRLPDLSNTLWDTSVHRILGNGKINLAEPLERAGQTLTEGGPTLTFKTAWSESTQPLNSTIHYLEESDLVDIHSVCFPTERRKRASQEHRSILPEPVRPVRPRTGAGVRNRHQHD